MTKYSSLRIAVVMLSATLLAACASESVLNRRSNNALLEISILFTAKWWSLEQMENLDPNNPPVKETEVILTRWEYSDPIGVPHPDSFDVIAEIRNSGQSMISIGEVKTRARWKVGSINAVNAENTQ